MDKVTGEGVAWQHNNMKKVHFYNSATTRRSFLAPEGEIVTPSATSSSDLSSNATISVAWELERD